MDRYPNLSDFFGIESGRLRTYSKESPQLFRLWFPDPRGLCQELPAGIWRLIRLLLQAPLVLLLRGACTTKAPDLQAHDLDIEGILFSYFPL